MQVYNLRTKQVQVELSKLLVKLEVLRKEYAETHYKGLEYKKLLRVTNKLTKAINKVYTEGELLNDEYKELTGDYYDHRFYQPKLYKVG